MVRGVLTKARRATVAGSGRAATIGSARGSVVRAARSKRRAVAPRALDTFAINAMAHAVLRDVHAPEFMPLLVDNQRWAWPRWFAARRLASELAPYSRDIVGLSLASLIFGVWLATLALMFAQPESVMPNVFVGLGQGGLAKLASAAAVFVFRAWVTTGLFVTVHDAIHGQVTPSFSKLNHLIGSVLAFCYASFSYKLLYRDHWRHHADPTSEHDPDYYEGGLRTWLSRFMGHYSTFWQLFWESFQFWSFCAVGHRLLHIEFGSMVVRVAMIWALPSLVSGFQLFYFGTYLPHKDHPDSEHSSRSNDWPWVLSLLSCFHFGACHEEHHAFPTVAWWELPAVRAKRKRL